jgi:hypothetical protein
MSRLHNFIEFKKSKGIAHLILDNIHLNEETHKYLFKEKHIINADKDPIALSGTTIMK